MNGTNTTLSESIMDADVNTDCLDGVLCAYFDEKRYDAFNQAVVNVNRLARTVKQRKTRAQIEERSADNKLDFLKVKIEEGKSNQRVLDSRIREFNSIKNTLERDLFSQKSINADRNRTLMNSTSDVTMEDNELNEQMERFANIISKNLEIKSSLGDLVLKEQNK